MDTQIDLLPLRAPEGATPGPRPTMPSRAAIERIVAEIDARLVKADFVDVRDEAASCEEILSVAEPYMDGYEIARGLEERFGWNASLPMADILDVFSTRWYRAVEAAQEDWVFYYDVRAKLAIGARVSTPKDQTGTVVDIIRKSAKYMIELDPCECATKRPIGRPIYPFEAVKAVLESAPA